MQEEACSMHISKLFCVISTHSEVEHVHMYSHLCYKLIQLGFGDQSSYAGNVTISYIHTKDSRIGASGYSPLPSQICELKE